jgi:hypothetical protein
MLDEPCANERLNGCAAIDVHVSDAARRQPAENLRWLSGHSLNDNTRWWGRKRPVAQDEHRLASVWPYRHRENDIVGVPSHDDRVDRGEKLLEAMGGPLGVSGRQKIERAVGPCEETIEACPDEDGRFHAGASDRCRIRLTATKRVQGSAAVPRRHDGTTRKTGNEADHSSNIWRALTTEAARFAAVVENRSSDRKWMCSQFHRRHNVRFGAVKFA